MDILSHSQQTAISNDIDLAYYIINYVDHELITMDILNKLNIKSDYINTTVNADKVLVLTLEASDCLYETFSQYIDNEPICVDISGKLYNIFVTSDDKNIMFTISPKD